MKKIIAASVVGLALVAGQAAAANQAAPRIADRVGATAGESEEFAAIPAPLIFIGAAVLAAVAIDQVVDDGDSD